MKKLLLILLALVLILLPSCNLTPNNDEAEKFITKDSFSYPKIELSAESVQSMIDGLATITTTEVVVLKSAIILTDEQKATIESKGWTLVVQ
jgi:hypothetical protein